MSEKLSTQSEKSGENINLNAEIAKNREQIDSAAHEAEKNHPGKHLETIRSSVEQQAISGKEVAPTGNSEAGSQVIGTQKELKADAYRRSISKVQSQLSFGSRVLSKTIHKPLIENISNVTASTAARPSGVFGGSLVALLGSGTLLYMSKYYGFSYSFSAIFILFIGGFFSGMLIEIIIRTLTKNHHR